MKFDKSKELIPIWGDVIHGNTGERILDRMHWDDTLSFEEIFT